MQANQYSMSEWPTTMDMEETWGIMIAKKKIRVESLIEQTREGYDET